MRTPTTLHCVPREASSPDPCRYRTGPRGDAWTARESEHRRFRIRVGGGWQHTQSQPERLVSRRSRVRLLLFGPVKTCAHLGSVLPGCLRRQPGQHCVRSQRARVLHVAQGERAVALKSVRHFFILICMTKPGHRGLPVRNRRQQGSHERVCVAHRTRRGPAIPPLHDAPPPPRAPHTSL